MDLLLSGLYRDEDYYKDSVLDTFSGQMKNWLAIDDRERESFQSFLVLVSWK